jgi:hypothetical protein
MEMMKREFSQEQRRRMAESGAAMPDGSYPIATRADLENAIQAYGRASNKPATKEHIIRRARALGLERLLPEEWKNPDMKKAAWSGVFIPRSWKA